MVLGADSIRIHIQLKMPQYGRSHHPPPTGAIDERKNNICKFYLWIYGVVVHVTTTLRLPLPKLRSRYMYIIYIYIILVLVPMHALHRQTIWYITAERQYLFIRGMFSLRGRCFRDIDGFPSRRILTGMWPRAALYVYGTNTCSFY